MQAVNPRVPLDPTELNRSGNKTYHHSFTAAIRSIAALILLKFVCLKAVERARDGNVLCKRAVNLALSAWALMRYQLPMAVPTIHNVQARSFVCCRELQNPIVDSRAHLNGYRLARGCVPESFLHNTRLLSVYTSSGGNAFLGDFHELPRLERSFGRLDKVICLQVPASPARAGETTSRFTHEHFGSSFS